MILPGADFGSEGHEQLDGRPDRRIAKPRFPNDKVGLSVNRVDQPDVRESPPADFLARRAFRVRSGCPARWVSGGGAGVERDPAFGVLSDQESRKTPWHDIVRKAGAQHQPDRRRRDAVSRDRARVRRDPDRSGRDRAPHERQPRDLLRLVLGGGELRSAPLSGPAAGFAKARPVDQDREALLPMRPASTRTTDWSGASSP